MASVPLAWVQGGIAGGVFLCENGELWKSLYRQDNFRTGEPIVCAGLNGRVHKDSSRQEGMFSIQSTNCSTGQERKRDSDQQYGPRLQTGRVGRSDIGVIEVPHEVKVQSVST